MSNDSHMGVLDWIASISSPNVNDRNDRLVRSQLDFEEIIQAAKKRQFDKVPGYLMSIMYNNKQYNDDYEIQLVKAKAAAEAIFYFSDAGKFKEMDKALNHLDSTTDLFPNDEFIQLEKAKGRVSALTGYISCNKLTETETSLAVLENLAKKFNQNQSIQLQLAKAAAKTIPLYAKFGHLLEWHRLLYIIRNMTIEFPENQDFLYQLANALVGSMLYENKLRESEALQQTIANFKDILGQNSENNQELIICIGSFGVEAIIGCKEFDENTRYDSTLTLFDSIGKWLFDHQNMHLLLARSLVSNMRNYGERLKLTEVVNLWVILENLGHLSPNDQAIQLQFAKGYVNLIFAYGNAEKIGEMDEAFVGLEAIAQKFPNTEEIQLELARGAVETHFGYEKADVYRPSKLEKLKQIGKKFPDNQDIQLSLVLGAIYDIMPSIHSEEFVEAEEILALVLAISQRFPDNYEIHTARLKVIKDAIIGYSDLCREDKFDRSLEILNTHINITPDHPELQLMLARCGGIVTSDYAYIGKLGDSKEYMDKAELAFSYTKSIADKFINMPEMQHEFLTTVDWMVMYYNELGKYEDMIRSIAILESIEKRFPDNIKIQSEIKRTREIISKFGTKPA